ncbi:MAG: hypothetical protein JWM05_2335 [Acidimicrobiales bacterium]|nr:hypothetical protein [Acidimicrobiales bacterium]
MPPGPRPARLEDAGSPSPSATPPASPGVRPVRTGVRFRATPEPKPAPDPRPAPDARPAITRPPRPASFWGRYGIVYDIDGPKVRLGVGWAVLMAASLAARPVRPIGTAGLFAVVAAWAGLQIVDAWRDRQPGGHRWIAAVGAGALPLAAVVSTRAVGGVVLVFVAAALVAAAFDPARPGLFAAAGQTVFAGLFVGLAAASIVLTMRYELGAVITLLVLVGVYEASDFIVGTGASHPFEGPLAGFIAMAVVTFIVVLAAAPPFRGGDVWPYAAMAALLCPVGQMVGSALLPAADAPAPALRRLDSFLVLAPLWAWLIGLYLTRA